MVGGTRADMWIQDQDAWPALHPVAPSLVAQQHTAEKALSAYLLFISFLVAAICFPEKNKKKRPSVLPGCLFKTSKFGSPILHLKTNGYFLQKNLFPIFKISKLFLTSVLQSWFLEYQLEWFFKYVLFSYWAHKTCKFILNIFTI